MTGRKVPWTHAKALAYMMCNEVFGKCRTYFKRAARREDRRYQKMREKEEIAA